MKKIHLLLALVSSFLATGCYDTYGIYSGAQYEKTKASLVACLLL